MKFKNKIKFKHPEGSKVISTNQAPLFIAEIGLNHNGDMDTAKKMINAAKESGADFVKFQAFFPEDLFLKSKTPSELWEIFERCSLNPEQMQEISDFSRDAGIGFAASPFSPDWLDILTDLNSSFLKIASGDIVNPLLLEKAAKSKLPIILSSGAASLKEINRAVQFLENQGLRDLVLLYCVSLYPTPVEKLQLSRLTHYLKNFCPLAGFSDHTNGTWASPLSIALGARVIEKHFTINKNLPGPDNSISVDALEFKQMYEASLQAYESVKIKNEFPSSEEIEGQHWGRRGLYNRYEDNFTKADIPDSKELNFKNLSNLENKNNLKFVRPYNKVDFPFS